MAQLEFSSSFFEHDHESLQIGELYIAGDTDRSLWKMLNQRYTNFYRGARALVLWLWDKTHVLKVVGSNYGVVYWMDIFSH